MRRISFALLFILVIASLGCIEEGDQVKHPEYYFDVTHTSENNTYTITVKQYYDRVVSIDDVILDYRIGADSYYHFIGNVSYTARDYLTPRTITIYDLPDVGGKHNISVTIGFSDNDNDDKLTEGDTFTFTIMDLEDPNRKILSNSYLAMYNKHNMKADLGQTFLYGTLNDLEDDDHSISVPVDG